jgi:flavin-dependent dehydrogenase
MAKEARAAGAQFLYATRFAGAKHVGSRIRLDGIDVTAHYIIGADGARSRVAEAFGLSSNRRFLTGLELPLSRIAVPGVLLVGDAAGWVSPMTGGGVRLAFRYGRRAASLVADHLLNGGAAPEVALK